MHFPHIQRLEISMFRKTVLSFIMITLMAAAFGCNSNRNADSSSAETTPASTEMTTATGVVYVPMTDSEGNNVTDNEGNAITTVQPVIITQIPETTYVTVTDDNGEAVTDDRGEVVTSAQTIWVTTMQAVTTAPVETPAETDTYSETQKITTTSKTVTTTILTTSTGAVTTTTTSADSGESDSESSGSDSGSTYAYGALSSVVVDLIDTKEDGEFINLVFNVKDDADGVYAVNIYDIMIANIDLEVSEFATANGCVSVGSPIQTDVPTGGTPIIYVSSVEGFAGEQIVVPIYIKNNTGVSAFDFRVEYDASGLELTSIEKGSIINSNSWIWTTNLNYTP